MRLIRRLTWHPTTAAALIAVAAVMVAATALPHGEADRLSSWLVIGAAAGFATSGST
jgi:hypothetical protein